MTTDLRDILPNTPTYITKPLRDTDDSPYVVIEDHLIFVPRGKSIKELGECIKALTGELQLPDKHGLREMRFMGKDFLILQAITGIYVIIYNIAPQYNAALCHYLAGNFIVYEIGLLETILCLHPGTMTGIDDKRYTPLLQGAIQRLILSEKAVC